MKENPDHPNSEPTLIFSLTFKRIAVCLIFIWVVFALLALVLVVGGEGEGLSRLGSGFNIINSIFSGFALVVIASQLCLQGEQLQIEKKNRQQDQKALELKVTEEKKDRQKSQRIVAMTSRITTLSKKIQIERSILLEIAPSFKNVSFQHDKDGNEAAISGEVKAGLAVSIFELVEEINKHKQWRSGNERMEKMKEFWDNKAAGEMLTQIAAWHTKIIFYEDELDKLLNQPPTTTT